MDDYWWSQCITNEQEKRNGAPMNNSICNLFISKTDRCQLMDIHSNDHFFMWPGPKAQKYDKFFKGLVEVFVIRTRDFGFMKLSLENAH